jgi:phospholipid-transporting ATPase
MGMFVGLLIFCIFGSIMNFIWFKLMASNNRYMFLSSRNFFVDFLIRMGNWVIIFGNVVPISLMVSLEGVKFIQALVMSRDKSMATGNIFCEVQSSNLNEELGQVQYLFSDKTGTLTRNEMIFRKLLIEDVPYGEEFKLQCESDSEEEEDLIEMEGKSSCRGGRVTLR